MSAKIYDEEDLLRSLQVFVKAGLNTQIAAINAQKADFTVAPIKADDRHYVFAGELQDLPNGEFVNFTIDREIETVTNQSDIISRPTVIIEACFDNEKAPNTYFKSLRLMRALYQTILLYEASTNEVGGLQITKAIPMVVPTATGRKLLVSGVILQVALG